MKFLSPKTNLALENGSLEDEISLGAQPIFRGLGRVAKIHPKNINMESEHHLFEKETHLPSTSIIVFHVNLPGCRSKTFILNLHFLWVHVNFQGCRIHSPRNRDTQTLLVMVFRNHLAADTGPGAVFTPSPPPKKILNQKWLIYPPWKLI